MTPAIYKLTGAIVITDTGFVVLGIGFPTLMAVSGNSALEVQGAGVHVAAVLFEAGTAKGHTTQPLLSWKGQDGVAHDIFGRVASLKYMNCPVVQADVMMQVDGDGLVLDHTWQWHADHDDCGTKSNDCSSTSGLRVNGNGVTAYGVQVEHNFGSLLDWHGDDGRLYFYQAELPYHDNDINIVGYNVDYNVKSHLAYGLGVYIIHNTPSDVHAAIRVPATGKIFNMWSWAIGGSGREFHHLVCMDAADQNCRPCNGNPCYLNYVGPTLRGNDIVVL